MAQLPVRADLLGESPYGAPQLDVPVRLNVNENPYAPDLDVVQSIARYVEQAAQQLNRYPDRDFVQLRRDLAEYLAAESDVRLAPEQIWAANGSNEVMLQLLQAFGGPGRTVASFTPTYSMYPEYARDTFTAYVAGERNADFSLNFDQIRRVLDTEHPAIVLIASPNNPTGTAVSHGELRELLHLTASSGPQLSHMHASETLHDALPYDTQRASTIVVVDEAYGEFRRDGVPSALALLDDFPHLVVSRTMSKAFGAAGLRLGYMAASRGIIEQVMLVRLPYHLSALTQAAARGALAHRDSLMSQVAQIRVERDRLAGELTGLGLEVAPSDANFIFFGKFSDQHDIWEKLLQRGILIREVGPDGWLRVSIGTPQENLAFVTALREIISATGGERATGEK